MTPTAAERARQAVVQFTGMHLPSEHNHLHGIIEAAIRDAEQDTTQRATLAERERDKLAAELARVTPYLAMHNAMGYGLS